MKQHRSIRHRKRQVSRQRVMAPRPRDLGRPPAAYRQRGHNSSERKSDFYAHEIWYEPTGATQVRFVCEQPGEGFMHPVSVDEIQQRMALLPERFTRQLEVVQLSRMTRKRSLFPAYGMQWGQNVYLYPIEETFVETYVRPPTPQQRIEARMYGGVWSQDGALWKLEWSLPALKDFYLNNVLIHEIGHVNDMRNTNMEDRERFANWFAIEYGYRTSRGRR